MFWGLSGNVLPWQPGDVIMFNSSQIHATGRMPENTSKLGISMLFQLESDEECEKYKLNPAFNFATI
jgi:ectoine hydroxylase-related dioxygenase (phytanoyl-CoA dioxygenase family)